MGLGPRSRHGAPVVQSLDDPAGASDALYDGRRHHHRLAKGQLEELPSKLRHPPGGLRHPHPPEHLPVLDVSRPSPWCDPRRGHRRLRRHRRGPMLLRGRHHRSGILSRDVGPTTGSRRELVPIFPPPMHEAKAALWRLYRPPRRRLCLPGLRRQLPENRDGRLPSGR